MAIEIIKQGQTKFTAYCSQCGCKFTYELEDLNAAECIECPCCGHTILHNKVDNCRRIERYKELVATKRCGDKRTGDIGFKHHT